MRDPSERGARSVPWEPANAGDPACGSDPGSVGDPTGACDPAPGGDGVSTSHPFAAAGAARRGDPGHRDGADASQRSEAPGQAAADGAGGQLVFVYGTLKRGQSNHGQLQAAACAGEAVLDGLVLHDLGPFPMAIAGPGRVRGELYRVSADQLAGLDRFEGVPRLYQRLRWRLDDGRSVWVYVGHPRQVRHSPRLPQGIWTPAPQPRRCASRGPLLALGALCWLLQPPWARADADLGLCLRWQRSSGEQRILLGNAIGAAASLTKVHRLAESPPEAPVPLYAEVDLQRTCRAWR